MNDITCYLCDKEFEFHDEDINTTSDIVDGEYVEFEVVFCPYCELSIKI